MSQHNPQRIVCLQPSATVIGLSALDNSDRVVASHSLLCRCCTRRYEYGKRLIVAEPWSARTDLRSFVQHRIWSSPLCLIRARSGVANTQGWNSLSGLGAADVEADICSDIATIAGVVGAGETRDCSWFKMQAAVDVALALKLAG